MEERDCCDQATNIARMMRVEQSQTLSMRTFEKPSESPPTVPYHALPSRR